MSTRTRPTKQIAPPPMPAPNGNGQSNRTPVLTVYSDGTIIVAPELTGGDALRIADTIRQAVLAQPFARPQVTPAPEPEHDMITGNPYADRHLP